MPGELTIHEQIERTGAPALLLEHYAGRLEEHVPWHTGREVSHLLRGLVDADEADALLAERGHGTLRLIDNGAVRRRSPALADLPEVRAYHLRPEGVSKAQRGRARISACAGSIPRDCVAVGDSREDLGRRGRRRHVLARRQRARARPRHRAPLAGAHANVRVAEASHGAGVYEAVVTTLAERRGRVG